jgi:ribonuclease BN (tRNA processing enzyme)
MPHPDRINSGYVLDVDERLIQFDCGGGISHSFRRAGFDPLAVERFIISHTHPDHISDLPLYVQMIYLAGRVQGSLIIHLPAEAIDPITEYFRTLYLMPEKLPFTIEFVPIKDGEIIDLDEISIRPILNNHLKGNRQLVEEHDLANRMECFSFLIRIGEKSIIYSADLGSEHDISGHLKDIDLLVVESTHIDVEHLLLTTIDNNVGRIVLTHFNEDYDVDQALTMAQKMGVTNLSIAEDGMRIEL